VQEQFMMGPTLNDPSVSHHDDFVAVPDGAQPVRDDDASTASAAKIIIDGFFNTGIERGGGLIEDDDRRISGKRTGDLDPLTLATAEIPAVLRDMAIVVSGTDRNLLLGSTTSKVDPGRDYIDTR
jgi:hypothetical protein